MTAYRADAADFPLSAEGSHEIARDVLFAATLFAVVTGLVFFPAEHDSKFIEASDGTSLYRVVFPVLLGLTLVLRAARGMPSAAHLALAASVAAVPLAMTLPAFSSVLWDISFRRGLLSAIVGASLVLQVSMYRDVGRVVAIASLASAAVLALNYVGVFLMGGVHVHEVIGSWRGLYGHKNLAGAGAAIAFLLFAGSALATRGRSRIGWSVATLGAAGFLLGSESKTAIAVMPLAVLYAYGGLLMLRGGILGRTCFVLATAVLVGACASFHVWGEAAASSMGIDATFTGRTAIWEIVRYVADLRPAFGWGFGIFFEGPLGSPFFSLAGDDFLRAIGHAHSGWLNVLAHGGWTSFAAVVAIVTLPVVFLDPAKANRATGVLLAVWAFCILRNVLEADLLEPIRPAWVFLATAIAALLIEPTEHEETER